MSTSEEIRARCILRYLSLLIPSGLGLYFVTGHGFDLFGQRFGDPYLGGFLILLGVLGLLGLNIWIGGPLDKRRDDQIGERPKPKDEEIPKHIVHQQVRNHIVDCLELAGSREQLLEYQRDVFYADVLGELFAIWEDGVHIDLAPEQSIEEAHPSPIYTDEERMAILEFHRVRNDVLDRMPEDIHSIQEFVETPLWRELADAATRSLAVFQRRGKSPEN